MTSRLLRVVAVALLFFAWSSAYLRAQNSAARESEWQAYRLPSTPFARVVEPSKNLILRLPESWKQQAGERLVFAADDETQLVVHVEEVPEGIGLKSVLMSLLQGLRELPGGADALAVRRVQFAGLEGREISFEMQDLKGDASRRTIWMTVDGAQAITFIFITPANRAAETLPYFKAVAQSAIYLSSDEKRPNAFDIQLFEHLRTAAIPESKPARVDETQALVMALETGESSQRAQAEARLAQLFASHADATIDLLLEARPLVRAAVVRALAASGNERLRPFLYHAITEADAFVAAQAAQAVAASESLFDHWYQSSYLHDRAYALRVLRAGAMFDAPTRVKLANALFESQRQKKQTLPAGVLPLPPPPPARAKTPPKPPRARKRASTSEPLGFIAIEELPKEVAERVKKAREMARDLPEPHEHFLALNLLRDVPPSLLAMPFADILAKGNESLIVFALQVALERQESLSADRLLALLDSPRAALLAAQNLGRATTPDLSKLEARLQQLIAAAEQTGSGKASAPPAAAKPTTAKTSPRQTLRPSGKRPQAASPAATSRTAARASTKNGSAAAPSLVEPLQTALQRLRLRALLTTADRQTRAALLEQAMKDAALADWVWLDHLRDEREGARTFHHPFKTSSVPSTNNAAQTNNTGKADASRQGQRQVAPFGENLLPPQVTLFAALPKPGAAFGKLADSLESLQMDTPREQAQMTLLLSTLRQQLTEALAASAGETFLEQVGIQADAPMAFANWTAEGAPRGLVTAQRSLALLRVSDRDRFERSLAIYQQQLGGFASFNGYVGGVSRFLGLLPAVLPWSAALALDQKPNDETPLYIKYGLVGSDECRGYAVKVIERRDLGVTTHFDRLYLAYVGDTALLAPDWYSLREALARLENGGETLAVNEDFRRAVASDGEVIYLSDLFAALDWVIGSRNSQAMSRVTEQGALRLSNGAWESGFELSFADRAWMEPLRPFNAQQLTAARSLLPQATFLYLLAKLDAPAAWRIWQKDLFGEADARDFAARWGLDFEQEVLPELGDECGIAVMGMPKTAAFEVPYALFFKLKSDKLTRALAEGKLLKDEGKLLKDEGKLLKDEGGGAANRRYPRLRLGSRAGAAELSVAIKNGFLILADSEASIERFDEKVKLADSRDFSRAAAQMPDNALLFGGYNLEAAVASLDLSTTDDRVKETVSMLTTVMRAFHSQNFQATATPQGLQARLSVQLAREGRYSVAEMAAKVKDFTLAFANVEARGAPLFEQKRLDTVKLKLKARSSGIPDSLRQSLATPHQSSETAGDGALLVTVRARRDAPRQATRLPVGGGEFAEYLKPTRQLRADDGNVQAKAKEIAGDDRDAWSVARKLADWTYTNLKWKRVDDADAAQTLATREADCLEFSELYVAMARSLGLPARLVTGLAYSDGAFGAHAWVEVYVGEWVELDPTWGTNFVDATHIRAASSDLISYAALNLLEVELLATSRTTPEFQRAAGTLVEKLCEDLSSNASEGLGAALDMRLLADEQMGAEAWEKMSEREREQFAAAQSSIFNELREGLAAAFTKEKVRLLTIREDGDRAVALVLQPRLLERLLIRLHLKRQGDGWFLTEAVQVDSDLHIIAEKLRPTVLTIQNQRANRQQQGAYLSAQSRAMIARQQDSALALEILNAGLQQQPEHQALRLLKAATLGDLADADAEADKEAEAEKKRAEQRQLLEGLANAAPPFAPAVLQLAMLYADTAVTDDEYVRARALYERYGALLPADPRPHEGIADLYEEQEAWAKAALALRAAIERDASHAQRYITLARYLVSDKRHAEAMQTLDEGAKRTATSEDLFAALFYDLILHSEEDATLPTLEAFAAAHPERFAKSAAAMLALANLRVSADRAAEALPLIHRAIALDGSNLSARLELAAAYRQLKNWRAALAAADDAIKLDAAAASAHYERARVLALSGRRADAIVALRRAVELDEVYLENLEEEADFKSLAQHPQFKKWVKQVKEAADDDK